MTDIVLTILLCIVHPCNITQNIPSVYYTVLYKNKVGIANNNPGNIKTIARNEYWKGQVGVDRQGHAIFSHVEWGLRAMAIVLKSYYHKHKINTINKLIDRYVQGPSTSRSKYKYKIHLAQQLGIGINESFNILKRMPDLMRAMIYYENGVNPYPDHLFALAGFMEGE